MVTRIERAFRTRSLSSTLGLSGALLVSACRYEAGSTGAAGADGTGTDDLGQANDPKSRDPVPPHDDPSPDPAEVEAWRWIAPAELEREMGDDPARFTAWLPLAWREIASAEDSAPREGG